MSARVAIILVTAPTGDPAEQIAETLVQERLAACVNRIENISSTYSWKGKIHHDREDLLVIKTAGDKAAEASSFIREVHPYDIPEILVFEVDKGDPAYLAWVLENVR